MDSDNHPPAGAPQDSALQAADPCPDQATVLERLGSTLRQARQERGLERPALAARLCMGDEQLKALEDGDGKRLPEPVFVIAQARRVADALGVDISLLIAPLKQSAAAAAPASGSRASAQRGPAVRAPGPRSSVRRSPAQWSGTPSRRSSSGRRQGAGPLPWLGWTAVVAGLAAAGIGGWPWLQRVAPQLSGKATAPRAAAPAATAAPSGPAARPAPPKPAPPRTVGLLQLSSRQPSWLEVQTLNQQVLFKGTFNGTRTFPLGGGLRVLAGRPDLVQVSADGAAPRALGTIDQIRWQRFAAGPAGQAASGTLTPPPPAAPAPAP